MLGLARNAQLAGWAASAAPAVATMQGSLTLQSELTSIHLTRPLITADFSTLDPDFGGFIFLSDGGSDPVIDTADLTTADARLSTAAYTVRIGSDFLPASNSFAPGFSFNPSWSFPGGNDFRQMGLFRDDFSNYIFNAQANAVALNATQFNAIRNRWIGLVVSTSTDTNDFSNWTGGSDWQGQGWAQRVLVVDLESSTVVGQADGWAFRPGTGIDLSETWRFFSGDHRFNFSASTGSNDPGENGNDMEFASAWYAVGAVLDPATAWPFICGTGAASTVSGVRAWFNIRMVDTDPADILGGDNNDVRGYRFQLPDWGHRIPNGSQIEVSENFGNPTPGVPTLTEY